MKISRLLDSAIRQSNSANQLIHEKWINISFRVGDLAPTSLLLSNIQNCGQIDMLLRCLENKALEIFNDNLPADFGAMNNQKIISEMWVGLLYEICRLIAERRMQIVNNDFILLLHHLRILRVPLEKLQIAADSRLKAPLRMTRIGDSETTNAPYVYDRADRNRSHIMPAGMSENGSLMWQVIDIENNTAVWIERLNLSNDFLELLTAK